MRRLHATLLLAALILGTYLVLPVTAQNYVWTSINGVPFGPGVQLGGSITFTPDNLYNIGADGATRPKNIYASDSIIGDVANITGATGFIGHRTRVLARAPAVGELTFMDYDETFAAGARMRYLVEANTGTKAPSATEAREWYTNTGDADGSIINLPDNPTVGLAYNVAVTAAQTITINTGTGETIWLAGTSCGTDISGSDTGASLLIVAVVGGSGGIWHAIGSGTWTC